MKDVPQKSVEQAILKDMSLPLFSEGWFVAGIVFGLSMGAMFYVFIGSVYFPGSTQPDASKSFGVFIMALVLAAVLCSIGLWCHTRYIAASGLHGVVAVQRRVVAGLLLFFGVAAVWQAFAQAAWLGLLSLVLVAAQLGVGWRLQPRFLNVIAGRAAKTVAALRMVDALAAFGIGLVGILAGLLVVMNAAPGSFFLLLTQVLSAVAVPWVPAMWAVAGMHGRAALTKA